MPVAEPPQLRLSPDSKRYVDLVDFADRNARASENRITTTQAVASSACRLESLLRPAFYPAILAAAVQRFGSAQRLMESLQTPNTSFQETGWVALRHPRRRH